MIYLIGGPPKCGKTTLAKKLSKELNISWISADTLQNIVKAYTPKEKHKTSFPHSYLREDSNDTFYSKYSTDEIIKQYIEQGRVTYNAIYMMVETYLTDEDNFIVEGYQITPEVVNDIFNKFGKEHVRAVFMVKKDEQKFIQDIHKSITPNDWIIKRTKNESTFSKIAKMVYEYSDYFEKEAEKYKLDVFNMDSEFENQINLIKEKIQK